MTNRTVIFDPQYPTPVRALDLGDGSYALAVSGPPLTPVSAEFTRPANTTQYANRDVIGPVVAANLTFASILGAGVLGGAGYIAKARVMTTQKTALALLRLHLFHTAPTVIADNDPYLLLWANRDKRIGSIDFPALATEDPTNSTAAYTLWTGPPLHFKCAPADANIYGILQNVVANYTPDDGQQFFVELSADRAG